jgi:hypothetical protein
VCFAAIAAALENTGARLVTGLHGFQVIHQRLRHVEGQPFAGLARYEGHAAFVQFHLLPCQPGHVAKEEQVERRTFGHLFCSSRVPVHSIKRCCVLL